MRRSSLTALQKTYDECFLICSTALYFEGQSNETEALRSWKDGLDKICYERYTRSSSDARSRTETEKALNESLNEMETQCRERITTLQTLRESRKEPSKNPYSTFNSHPSSSHSANRPAQYNKGYFDGDPVATSSSSNPSSQSGESQSNGAPPLPARPRLQHADTTPVFANSPIASNPRAFPSGARSPTAPIKMNPPSEQKKGRSPSPEKVRGLKTTLRTDKGGAKRTSSKQPWSYRPAAASKAATQAWSSVSKGSGEELLRRSEGRRGSANSLFTLNNDSSPTVRTNGAMSAGGARRSWDSPGVRGAASPLGFPPQTPDPDPMPTRDNISTPRRPQILFYNSPQVSTDKLPNITRRRPPSPDKSGPSASVSIPKYPTYRQGYGSKGRSTLPSTPPTRANAKTMARSPGRKSIPTQQPMLSQDLNGCNLSPTHESQSAMSPVAEEVAEKEKTEIFLKSLPRNVDQTSARAILNEIVVHGDEVHWDDVAGLDAAKSALKEAVVYPFLRPDLFMGLREPARGMLLFGPPGTGKTMIARAVATESKSTFFSISASSLTSKFLGESEKLVRALFVVARHLAPSIIFVDEIDSLLGTRGGGSEHEATRRIKTEFLIQWSELQRAAQGSKAGGEAGDANRVLVLAATNLPWAIDEAARRRFVRRQYIPLPEAHVRRHQLDRLLGYQHHELSDEDLNRLVGMTEGFSGSDITALAKDAAMGPLRSLGEALLSMTMDDIRPIQFQDFEKSLISIRPSVGKAGLKKYEDWSKEFGERGV